jgi:hypothetical protein
LLLAYGLTGFSGDVVDIGSLIFELQMDAVDEYIVYVMSN